MAAILRDPAIVTLHTRPQAIPLAITLRKINSRVYFSLLHEYGARLAALRVAGAPLLAELLQCFSLFV